jgi:tetratricopeptide (TPR) repeat protein
MRRPALIVSGLFVLAAAGGGAAYWLNLDPAPPPVPVTTPRPAADPAAVRAAAEEAWLRGNAAMEREAFDEALAAYEEAIATDASYALAYLGRGNARLARQAYNAALADFDVAVERDPALADAYLSRATTNWLLGRLFEAETDFRRLAEMYPDNSFYAARLGNVLVEAGKPQQAEQFYQGAYARNPANDWALLNWLAFVRLRGPDQVVATGLALSQGGVDTPALRASLGEAYLALRDYGAAISWLAPVLEADANSVPTDAIYHLATAYAGAGQLDSCRGAMLNYLGRMGRSHQHGPTICDGTAPT